MITWKRLEKGWYSATKNGYVVITICKEGHKNWVLYSDYVASTISCDSLKSAKESAERIAHCIRVMEDG